MRHQKVFLILVLALSLVWAADSTSFDISSFHLGTAGSIGETASTTLTSTTTSQQGTSDELVTMLFTLDAGWMSSMSNWWDSEEVVTGQNRWFYGAIPFPARRSILVTHSVASEATGPAEFNITFEGFYPYCNDGNTDGDLNDASDELAIEIYQFWANDSMGAVPFQLEDWVDFGCVDNELHNATIRFKANFTSTTNDFGYGNGNSLYYIFYDTASHTSRATEGLGSQTESATIKLGPEERKWASEWQDYNGNDFTYRARIYVNNTYQEWRFGDELETGMNFHKNLYCYDNNGDNLLESGELLSMRVVHEYDDGFAEIPFNFTGVCDEEVTDAIVSFIANIHPTPSCSNSFFVYYKPAGLAMPDYPDVSGEASDIGTRRGKETQSSATDYCGNFVCEDSEDICECPNDCCSTVRNGVCDGLCASRDPDCCSGCWSDRYLCASGRGADCYPGRCKDGVCVNTCDDASDCSSGLCYNVTATKTCFGEPAENNTVLSIDEGYACKDNYNSNTFTCEAVCFSVEGQTYHEYDGSPVVMDFTINNDCGTEIKPRISVEGPLSDYSALTSTYTSWDGDYVTIPAGSSASISATLSEVPADLVGLHELKFSAKYGNDIAGISPQVVIFPNTAYTLGRTLPPLARIGRTSYTSTLEGVPVKVVVSTW